MQRSIVEADFKQTNYESKVDAFKAVLDKLDQNLAELERQHTSSVAQAVEKTSKIQSELNVRIHDVAKR